MSKIEVNTVEPQCGTNLTLGANNDTVSLGTGAGFTGGIDAVKWETTPQTASFAATAGRGYFMNTTSGALTLTLPASPSAGDIVAVKDYALTFATNNLTIGRNSSNINGVASDVTIDTNGASLVLVYVDGTKGWIPTQDDSSSLGASFVTATGGTITTCGNFKIHTFTGPGTFTVSCAGNSLGSNSVDYLVIGGGAAGGGGADGAGGGGAGGYRFSNGAASGCYCAGPSPLGASALPVTATGYPITVGGGGSPNPGSASSRGGCGNNSVFSTITSAAGGSGGMGDISPAPANKDGLAGGSGGGGGTFNPGTPGQGAVGSGNTPPVSPPQGNNGGTGATDNASYRVGGGGGGAGAVGGSVCNPAPQGGNGGNGLASTITGSAVTRAGGGGGGGHPGGGRAGGQGGSGGGGKGGRYAPPQSDPATAGTANTGSGGGGSGFICGGTASGAGGSGIVIIRYKYQ